MYIHQIIKRLEKGNLVFNSLSLEEKKEQKVLLFMIKKNAGFIKKVPEEIKNSREFIINAIKVNVQVVEHEPYLLEDPEFLLAAVANNGLLLKNVKEKYKDDYSVAKEAIKNNPLSIEYISKRLQDDITLVKESVTNCPSLIEFASTRIKEDKNIIMQIVALNPNVINFLSKDLTKDEEIMELYIRLSSIENWNIVDDSLKNNKEFILKIIDINAFVVQYLSQEWLSDKEIARKALSKKGNTVMYFSQSIKADPDLMLGILNEKVGKYLIHNVDESLLRNKDFFMKAIVKTEGYYFEIEPSFLGDRDVVNLLLDYSYEIIMKTSPELKDDDLLMSKALKKNGLVLNYASRRIQNDKQMVLLAMKTNVISLKYASEILQNDKELLEILKSADINTTKLKQNINWYEERMDVLNTYERKQELELLLKDKKMSSTMKHKF